MPKPRLLIHLTALLCAGVVLVTVWLWPHNAPADNYRLIRLRLGVAMINAQVPQSLALQEKGLGGVTALSDHEGMAWIYDTPQMVSFWMKGMKIPLDFIWVNDNQVVGVTPDVAPPSAGTPQLPIYHPPEPVDMVLEVRAGFAAKYNIKRGAWVLMIR